MKITIDSPPSAAQPLSPLYSQLARVEQADGSALLFVSGQIAEGDTIAEQSRAVFETLDALLKAHGAACGHHQHPYLPTSPTSTSCRNTAPYAGTFTGPRPSA